MKHTIEQKHAPKDPGQPTEPSWLEEDIQKLILGYCAAPLKDHRPSDPNVQDTRIIFAKRLQPGENNNGLGFFDKRVKQHYAASLLEHVVRGEEEKARAMIAKNPLLALEVVDQYTVIDYSGRKITGVSPFQAALRAGDVEMCQMILGQIDKAHNSKELREKAQAQFDEIFPQGVEAEIKAQEQNTFDFEPTLNAIFEAPDAEVSDALSLKGAAFEEAKEDRNKNWDELNLTKKLNRFRGKFAVHSKEEKKFNPSHLLKALVLYENDFDKRLDSWPKKNLFWRHVIGFTQRFLPACYAQAFAQGLCDITGGDKLKRSLTFQSGADHSFFPLAVSLSGLGFEYVALGGPGPRDVLGLPWYMLGSDDVGLFLFKTLCQTKTAGLSDFMRALSPPRSRCVIL